MTFFTRKFRYHATERAVGSSSQPWRTGFLRRAPVLGILALATALACGVGAIAVLVASNGLPIDRWRVQGHNVQPTVLLSVLATIANALFRYAFREGATISWWTRALRGTSLDGLYRQWDHAQGVVPILTSGKHISLLAVVSLATTLLLIDGPLLQRASSIKVSTKQVQKILNVPISPSPFLEGATGLYAYDDYESTPTLYSGLFSKALLQYNTRQPISLPDFGCKGRCEFEVIAPGFDIDCRTWHSPYRLASNNDYERAIGQIKNCTACHRVPALTQTMFWSNVTYYDLAAGLWYILRSYRTGDRAPVFDQNGDWIADYNATVPFQWNTIMLSSMVKATPGINGTLGWRSCVLREAVQRYPVTVINTTVTLHPPRLQQNSTVYQVVRESEDAGQGYWPSTLGGFWLALSHAFAGTADMQQLGPFAVIRTNDSSPLEYVEAPGLAAPQSDEDYYKMTWADPVDDMISMIQDLSFRTAIATTFQYAMPPSPGYNITSAQPEVLSPNLTLVNRTLSQTVNASMTYPETIYQADFGWLAGSVAVIIIAFIAVTPTFNGWWHLGRTVSMSPIEIAKAFDAPLLRYADPNGTASDLLEEVGASKIQYGTSQRFDREGGLGPSQVQRTVSRDDIGEDSPKALPRKTLHFGMRETVETPCEGATFS